MDVSHLLDELNDEQRAAVTAPEGHVLVLAGAGSGKTRVLVHRLAWLIQVGHVSPLGLLAVTFTNKAAGEMRERASKLLGISTRPLWIGTFHGIAHRLLRMHWKEAQAPSVAPAVVLELPANSAWPDHDTPERMALWAGDAALSRLVALKAALQGERRGYEFYYAVAGSTSDPSIRELANEFGKEEAEHVETLKHWIQREQAALTTSLPA